MNKIDNLKLYKDCLIIVDMLNGFVREGVLHDKEISKIIPKQIKLIKEAKETKQLIIFIKDNHTKESTEFARFGNTTHCLKGTSESEVVDELKIYEQEKDTIAMYKLLYDAYKVSHKKSYELLHEGLESALNHLPEDAVIFMLMEEIKEHRNISK